jgi:Fe-S cluster biosynthesis and repair protein YggX
MNDPDGFTCTRCGRADVPAVAAPPFPTRTGQRIAESICTECWESWKKHQMALINHYALNVRDPEARTFLTASMEGFLFGGDEEAGTGAPAAGDGGDGPPV